MIGGGIGARGAPPGLGMTMVGRARTSTAGDGRRLGNRLLAAFPPAEIRRLRPALERVPLAYQQYLMRPGEHTRHVYFPVRGIVSLVLRYADGASVQVAGIGNEGVAGLAGIFGLRSHIVDCIVLVPGSAIRVATAALRTAMEHDPRVARTIMGYGSMLYVETAYTAACNAHHTLEQRLARWLLSAHDSVARAEVAVSHEFLSVVLGTQRTGITAALGRLKRAGAIATGYGGITILDRKALERVACDCYRNVKRLYANLRRG